MFARSAFVFALTSKSAGVGSFSQMLLRALLSVTAAALLTGVSGRVEAQPVPADLTPVERFIPKDVLDGLAALDPAVRAKLCRANSGAISRIKSAVPYPELKGLLSNMTNQNSLPAMNSLSDFVPAVEELATTAFIHDDDALKATVRKSLASWAGKGAFLGTIDCTRQKCAEAWRSKYGDELAPVKDYDTILERILPMALAYQLVSQPDATGDVAAEQEAISKWFDAFLKRQHKWPEGGELRFGWGLDRSWTRVLQDALAGDEKKLGRDIDYIAKGLNALVLKDGSLWPFTYRGSFATWKHFEALNEVVVTLEILTANGRDAYPKFETRLHKAVTIMMDTFDNPEAIYPWAKKEYKGGGDYRKQDWGLANLSYTGGNSWLYIYSYRYPDHENTKRIAARLMELRQFHQSDEKVGMTLGCFYRANVPWMLERETR